MKAIGYFRVSTEEQSKNGLSLGVQREKYRQWCELMGHESIGEFSDEGISGKSIRNRPGFKEAVALSCKKKAILAVHDLSRLSRRTRHSLNTFAKLEKAGAKWCSIKEGFDTSTPMGKAVVTILLAINELERDNISERTSTALQEAQRMGKLVTWEGGIPYGFKLVSGTLGAKDGQIGPCEEEQKAVDFIMELYESGLKAYTISAHLEKTDFKPRGKKWYPKTVHRIIDAEKERRKHERKE